MLKVNPISSIIFVPKQSLIDSFNPKTLAALGGNYQYVCLGDDKFRKSYHGLICKDQKKNIETHKHLLTFTGFYALIENKLLNEKIYRLLEYDFEFINFDAKQEMAKLRNCDVIAYMNNSRCFYDCFNENYLLKRFMSAKGIRPDRINTDYWFSWGFITTRAVIIKPFYEWIKDFVLENKNHKSIAHTIERTFYLYCVINNIKFIQENQVIKHYGKRSHGIG